MLREILQLKNFKLQKDKLKEWNEILQRKEHYQFELNRKRTTNLKVYQKNRKFPSPRLSAKYSKNLLHKLKLYAETLER